MIVRVVLRIVGSATALVIADLVILGLAIKIIMGAVGRRRQPGGAPGAQPP